MSASWFQRQPWRRRSVRLGAALLLVCLGFWVALRLTPFPSALETPPPRSTEIVDRHGTPLRLLLAEERRYAQPCTLAEVSPALIAATLCAEDKRFYSHHGLDPLALARALWQLALGRPPASGASTITMQLVKLAQADAAAPGAHSAHPRTLARKLAETWLALRVEQSWSKEQILTAYLNRLEYGNLQVGVASASRAYFGKPALDLSPAEAALLAALPKAPTRLNPYAHRAEAEVRAHWVLGRMRALGHLEEADWSRALQTPVSLHPPAHDFAAPRFVDLLLARRNTIPAQGGAVRTTLDLPLQHWAESSLQENLRTLADKNATAGAAVVLENATGEVLALACASTAAAPEASDINTAWMIRSPGSAMKPFTYLLALQAGSHPGTVVPDVATDFPTPTGSYRPNNYNHRCYGPVSLRFALGNSLNVAAIRALELAGGPEALQQAMRAAGITTLDQPADYYGLGLTLGNGEVRLLELANAYATLARLGRSQPFRLLQNSASATPARQIFQPAAAWLLADMLADNAARASSFGIDSYLAFDFPVACKTGTSSDYRDNWCFGYTPEFTVGVWVGNANGAPMHGITGITGAAPVLHELFEHLHQTRGTGWYPMPRQVATYPVEPLTGHLVAPGSVGAVLEKGLRPPPASAPGDYDAGGRVLLPPAYAEWLGSPQNTLGSLVAGGAGPALPHAEVALQILEPSAGTVFYLDPDLPVQSQCIPLRVAHSASVIWIAPTLALHHSTAGVRAELVPGRHELRVRDQQSGQSASTWIQVFEL